VKGEIDLMGYDGETLAFIEVRTRTAREDQAALPELSVTAEKQHLVVTVTDELDPKATFGAREREQEWLRVNGPRHAGKWLAIEGDQLVGVGDNARVVLEQARANGIAHPLLVQIPNDPQLPFGGW